MMKEEHLAMRGLTGLLRKDMLLYRTAATDPLVFQGLFGEQVIPIVFKRDAAGQIDRLCMGFLGLYTLWRYREALPFAPTYEGWQRVTMGEGFTPLVTLDIHTPQIHLDRDKHARSADLPDKRAYPS